MNGRITARGSPLREILSRFQLRKDHPPAPEARRATGMQGAIEVIGAAGLLQMCHLARLTGTLEATHEARTVRMTFEIGRLATAASQEEQGREAVMDFLAWTDGRFAFQPGATAQGGPISETTEFLILEACRILDEKAAPRIDDEPMPTGATADGPDVAAILLEGTLSRRRTNGGHEEMP